MSDIKKILIRGVNWIGDAVLTTPAIRAIRKAFPDTHISLLVKPWVAGIFKKNPDINEIIIYEEKLNGIKDRLKLSRMLRSRGFNTAILLQNAFDAALIAWLARIPERIGYSRDWRRLLLTKAVPMKTVPSSQFSVPSSNNKNILKKHQVYYYLNLLKEALDIDTEDAEPLIYLGEEEINHAKALLDSRLQTSDFRPIIGINPGATYGSAKRWMPDRFAELIRRIIDELNARVVLFGSKTETEIANEISSQFPVLSSQLLNMTGKTTLRELAALISECDVFVTNDSGPMHIASALFVPIVALFGSTDSALTGPLGEGHKIINKNIPCSPCLERECPEKHFKCMKEITVEDVFNALQEILLREKAIFLDRDGTINEDVGYLSSFSELKIFKDAQENLHKLKKAGFRLIGITNQSGVARGFISEEFIRATNAYLQETLSLNDFYYCPHHPDNGCLCRKPRQMLLRKARLKHRINLKASYVIGDKHSDMLLAKGAGAKGILVLTGHDKESMDADFIAKNLTEAIDWILKQENYL